MSTAKLNVMSAMPAEPAAKLKPKEHGAYAILGIPIATSLVVAGPTLVGLCVAAASVAGFLAHEPVLVAFGHRGTRAQRTTPTARRQLGLLLAMTLTCGLIAMAAGNISVRWALVGCGLLAATSFALAITGKQRSLGGQLWGIVALSVPCVPILLAGDLSKSQTVEVWGTWLVGFAATTMAVRGVIAAQKRQSKMIHWAAITGLSILVGVLNINGFSLPIATLPMLLMSWYLMLDPPHPKQLKRVGWTLVVGTIASAVWMTTVL